MRVWPARLVTMHVGPVCTSLTSQTPSDHFQSLGLVGLACKTRDAWIDHESVWYMYRCLLKEVTVSSFLRLLCPSKQLIPNVKSFEQWLSEQWTLGNYKPLLSWFLVSQAKPSSTVAVVTTGHMGATYPPTTFIVPHGGRGLQAQYKLRTVIWLVKISCKDVEALIRPCFL